MVLYHALHNYNNVSIHYYSVSLRRRELKVVTTSMDCAPVSLIVDAVSHGNRHKPHAEISDLRAGVIVFTDQINIRDGKLSERVGEMNYNLNVCAPVLGYMRFTERQCINCACIVTVWTVFPVNVRL